MASRVIDDRVSARKLRIAVWGLGFHAVNRILPAIRRSSAVELRGVCSRNSVTVTAIATRYSCVGWLDADTMLRDRDVDVVFVATPTGLHYEHGMRVLESGMHLWCEKPLTVAREQTLALLAASRVMKLAVCEGLMYIHHPLVAALARCLSEQRLGALKSVNCRFGIPALDHATFRSDPNLGGGAFLDLACYPASAVLALLPEDTWTVLYAQIGRDEHSAVDTDGLAVLSSADGVMAHLEWRTQAAYRNEIEFWGERGSLYVDRVFAARSEFVPEFLFRDLRGMRSVELGKPGDQYTLMLDAFRSIVGDTELVEEEREKIALRAQLLSDIQETATRR